MTADEFPEQADAIGGLQIHDPRAHLPQPIERAGEIDRLAGDDRADAELARETAAVPARRESRDQDRVAVASSAARIPERVGLGVERRILVLNPPVVSPSQKPSLRVEQSGSDRDAAFGEAKAGLVQRDGKERRVIQGVFDVLRSAFDVG